MSFPDLSSYPWRSFVPFFFFLNANAEQKPKDAELHHNVAVILEENYHRLEDARQHYIEAVALQPNNYQFVSCSIFVDSNSAVS